MYLVNVWIYDDESQAMNKQILYQIFPKVSQNI